MIFRMITALALFSSLVVAVPVQAQIGIDLTGTTSGVGGVKAGIKTSADIMTKDDLNAYEEIILESDARLTDADSSNKKVAVSYKHDGRLLGMFTVELESRTTVTIDEEQNVKVETEMPWWSFLVAGTGHVRADVKQELMASSQFMADVILSDDAKARGRALEAMASAHAKAEVGS